MNRTLGDINYSISFDSLETDICWRSPLQHVRPVRHSFFSDTTISEMKRDVSCVFCPVCTISANTSSAVTHHGYWLSWSACPFGRALVREELLGNF